MRHDKLELKWESAYQVGNVIKTLLKIYEFSASNRGKLVEATNLLYEVFVEVTSGRDEEAKNLEVAAKQGLKLRGEKRYIFIFSPETLDRRGGSKKGVNGILWRDF